MDAVREAAIGSFKQSMIFVPHEIYH
jgi:hypothetical protein